MSYTSIQIDTDGPVATLTLNRPDALNAFDATLKAEMRAAVGRLNDEADLRVVILRGAGKGFSAGADIRDGIADPVSFHLDIEYKPFLTGIAQSDKLWIAQVHGAAAGVAAAVAMTCDLVTMSDDAYIYMAFAAIGLVPDGGNTQLLLQHMGYHRALEAILEGQKIPAQACLDFGIANKLFAPGDLETGTRQWAARLASGAPLALSGAKHLLRRVGRMSFGDAISEEGIIQTPLLNSEDFREGVAAFFEKRIPAWKGR